MPEHRPDQGSPRRAAFAWIAVAYLTALAAAAATIVWLNGSGDQHLLMQAAVADAMATLVVFGFSAAFRNSSFYDAYWSVAPLCLGLFWWWTLGANFEPRFWLAMLIVWGWSLRLTGNWARGWRGLGHEDWRYEGLQQQLGAYYWPVSLLGIHLMPTALVFAACLPLYFIASVGNDVGLNLLDALALVVGVGAVWLEARADQELARFRARRRSPGEVLRTGVWSWCRHPNYLGELGFWLALALFGAAAGAPLAWTFAGFVAMVLLFQLVSIPMIEGKLGGAKPEYADYRRRTGRLLPLGFLKGVVKRPI